MLARIFLFIALMGASIFALSVYYSDANLSARNFQSMLESGDRDLAVIEYYLQHHDQKTDADYDRAVQLAAALDTRHLDEVVHYYATGQLLITTETADLIVQQLPADSVELNYAAGRIHATDEFRHRNIPRAVELLEYAALRGDKNAAAELSEIYTRSDCYVEAITWAKQANKRDVSSECTKLPVDTSLLDADQWKAVFHNEEELEQAEQTGRLPELRYSENCVPR